MTFSTDLVDCLQKAKLLPKETAAFTPAAGDLLPQLRRAWQEVSHGSHHAGSRRAAKRRIDLLEQWERRGARLTVGPPCPESDDGWYRRRLAARLFWWPNGEPTRAHIRLHGVLCSRLGRSPERSAPWLRAVSRALRRLSGPRDWLLAVAGTAAHDFTQFCAAHWKIPVVSWHDKSSFAAFGKTVFSPPPAASESLNLAIISPRLATRQDTPARVPWADALLISGCDRLVMGAVRSHGNVARTLAEITSAGRTIPLLASQRVSPGVGNTPDPPCQARRRPTTHGVHLDRPTECRPVSELPSSADYLIHWTRMCCGAWPLQSTLDYWSDLLAGGWRAARSAFATLNRIARCRRIIAGRRTTRQGEPLVSFTAVPVTEFPNRRVYRAHRGRWDFELYGIGIRQDLLIDWGAREVRYRQTDGHQLDSFSQRARDRTGKIDWTLEREWRILGDVDLRDVASDDGFLFTKNAAEAQQLAHEGLWPVFFFEEKATDDL